MTWRGASSAAVGVTVAERDDVMSSGRIHSLSLTFTSPQNGSGGRSRQIWEGRIRLDHPSAPQCYT
jgi:hypothetical protein